MRGGCGKGRWGVGLVEVLCFLDWGLAEVVDCLCEGDEGISAAARDVFGDSDDETAAGCSLL